MCVTHTKVTKPQPCCAVNFLTPLCGTKSPISGPFTASPHTGGGGGGGGARNECKHVALVWAAGFEGLFDVEWGLAVERIRLVPCEQLQSQT